MFPVRSYWVCVQAGGRKGEQELMRTNENDIQSFILMKWNGSFPHLKKKKSGS